MVSYGPPNKWPGVFMSVRYRVTRESGLDQVVDMEYLPLP